MQHEHRASQPSTHTLSLSILLDFRPAVAVHHFLKGDHDRLSGARLSATHLYPFFSL